MIELTEEEITDMCYSVRHDYGIMAEKDQEYVRFWIINSYHALCKLERFKKKLSNDPIKAWEK